MGTTSPDNIYFVDASLSVDPPAESAAQASSVQTALTARQIRTYKWANQAARLAQSGMAAGDEGYQTDTGATYRYNGTIWRNTAQALYLMIPTASSGTISQNGVVSFGSVSSVTVDGCFTSEFSNYMVALDIPTTSAVLALNMQMRTGGANNTVAVYDLEQNYASGGSATPIASNILAATSWVVAAGTSSIHAGEFKMFRPYLPTATFVMADTMATQNPMGNNTTTAIAQKAMLHRNSTSFDGFSIASSTAGLMSGTLRVYGYTGV